MMTYCIIGLMALVLLLWGVQTYKYIKLIEQLTDKLMSRNFADYSMGKALKKDDKEVENVERSDKTEMLIEKAKEEGKKLKDVEAEFNKKIQDITV